MATISTYLGVWLVEWVLMTALWFAFVAKLELAEALAGIAAAAIAATGDLIIRRGGFAKFKPKAAWLAQSWRVPGYIISDTAVVFVVLFRRLIQGKKPRSVLRSISFEAVGPSSREAAQRALALTLNTISPNLIVIGIDRKDESILIHQLRQAGVSELMRSLGAGK